MAKPETELLDDLVPISLADLRESSATFDADVEKSGGFYDMARRLIEARFEIEACVLILATWNFASFRYVATSFDTDGLRKCLQDLRGDFDALSKCTIKNIDLDQHRTRIEGIFSRLSAMDEVRYTGATKVMHLECPELFVIWDAYIRGEQPKRFYVNLPCIRQKKWRYRKYDKAKEYVEFLSDMQSRVRDLEYTNRSKTLAKAIDEFNFVNVTLPIQKMEFEEALGAARNAIIKISPRSESDAVSLKQLIKDATVTRKLAENAVESLVKDGSLVVVLGEADDSTRYWSELPV